MKKIFFVLLVFFLVAVSSCSMAKFDHYPGVKQDSIPTDFRGSYFFKLGKNSKDPKDSVYIIISKSGWKQYENNRKDEYKLSGDIVFSTVGKYFVLSKRDESAKKYWNSWVILPKKNNFEIYPIVTINHPNDDKLSNYLTHKFSGLNGTDSIFYYEMNEDAFVKYFEKEIRGNKTFEIIHINNKK